MSGMSLQTTSEFRLKKTYVICPNCRSNDARHDRICRQFDPVPNRA